MPLFCYNFNIKPICQLTSTNFCAKPADTKMFERVQTTFEKGGSKVDYWENGCGCFILGAVLFIVVVELVSQLIFRLAS